MQSAVDRLVFEKVSHALRQVVRADLANLSPSTRINDDLALSRFGRLRLAICLEETFDVELEDDEVEGFAVVGDIVGHISTRYFRDSEFASGE